MTERQTTPTRASYRLGSATVQVATDEEAAGRWLAEFVTPWFAAGLPGDEGPRVHLVSSDERFATLAARQARTAVVEVPCFGLDSVLASHPGWMEEDGTTVAVDVKFGCFYGMRARQVEVVARSGDRNARIGLLRAVREILALRMRTSPVLDLHAAAFVWRGRAVLVAGGKNAGKTTLLAHALSSGEVELLANDRVLVTADGQARGVPTVVSVREGTVRSFPAVAAGLPGNAALLTADELASTPEQAERADGRMMLTPGQFAGQLGARLVASAPVGAVVFPEVSPDHAGCSLLPITQADAAARLREAKYGRRAGPGGSTWFHSLAGTPWPAEAQEALADRLAANIPGVRCLLGPDAYRDGAGAWLSALPLSGGTAGTAGPQGPGGRSGP
jgi:hypothetical protein